MSREWEERKLIQIQVRTLVLTLAFALETERPRQRIAETRPNGKLLSLNQLTHKTGAARNSTHNMQPECGKNPYRHYNRTLNRSQSPTADSKCVRRSWSLRSNVDQSALQCNQHSLRPIARPEAREDDAYMAFYCGLGDAKIRGNLLVRFAFGD